MKFFFSLLILSYLFFSTGCFKEQKETSPDKYFISQDEILQIFKNYPTQSLDNQLVGQREDARSITSIGSFKDSTRLEAIYVLNYKEVAQDYFVIFSADSRVIPVLAYGEGSFPINERLADGVADWIDQTLANFTSLRQTYSEPSIEVTNQWNAYKVVPDDDGSCFPSF